MEAMLTNASGQMTLGTGVVRVGSAQDNHVVINDPHVAPYHAEIRPEGHREHSHTIIDLGSMTGTFLNEWRLDSNVPSLLHPHDTIRIGDAIFNYELIDVPPEDEDDQSTMPALANVGDRSPVPNGGVHLIAPEAPPPREMPPQAGAVPSPFAGNPSPQGPLRIVPPDRVAHYPAAAASSAQPAAIQGENVAYPGREDAGGYTPFAVPPAIVSGSPFVSAPSRQSSSSGQAQGAPDTINRPATGAPSAVGPADLLKKQNRRKLWLAGGLTAIVIVVVALLFGNFHSPGRTLDTFCNALLNGDYQTAYNQLAPGMQGRYTESSFANVFSGSRRITSCAHSSPNVSGNSAEATIITNSSHASTVWLIQDSSLNWRIDSLSGL